MGKKGAVEDEDDSDSSGSSPAPSGSADTTSAATTEDAGTGGGANRFLADDSTFSLRGSTPHLDLVDALPTESQWHRWQDVSGGHSMQPSYWRRLRIAVAFLMSGNV